MECHVSTDPSRAVVKQTEKPLVLRIGCGGGGYGDALATRPCAELLAYEGVGKREVYFATRFGHAYEGVCPTAPYNWPDHNDCELIELHWATIPEGPMNHYEAFYADAANKLDSPLAVTTMMEGRCGSIRPTWSVDRKPTRLIVLNTYAGLPERRWPLDRWNEVAIRLKYNAWTVQQINPGHGLMIPGVDAVTIQETQAIADYLAGAALYIGNESALWFIAMGIGLPSVTVHGPNDGSWYNVDPILHRTINAKGICKHCHDRGPWNTGETDEEFSYERWDEWYGKMRTKMAQCGQPCMDHSVDEVYATIKDHLAATWRG